jgi:UDP-N-acetylmuramate-alanine ligase
MLLAKITNPNKRILPKPELVNYLSGRKNEGAVILTVGAGDIDRLVGDITKALG